jgi:hypothetical protein
LRLLRTSSKLVKQLIACQLWRHTPRSPRSFLNASGQSVSLRQIAPRIVIIVLMLASIQCRDSDSGPTSPTTSTRVITLSGNLALGDAGGRSLLSEDVQEMCSE